MWVVMVILWMFMQLCRDQNQDLAKLHLQGTVSKSREQEEPCNTSHIENNFNKLH